jgi:hypothetical protein
VGSCQSKASTTKAFLTFKVWSSSALHWLDQRVFRRFALKVETAGFSEMSKQTNYGTSSPFTGFYNPLAGF